MLFSKMFQSMLNFERKINKEREEHDKKMKYFGYHKERHIIHYCFILFPHLKSSNGTSRQDRKKKSSKDGFKGKWKTKALNIIWDVESDDDNNDSDNEASQLQEINFALMIMVEDLSNDMDVETIIVTKNITDPITIEFLRKIVEFKNPKTQPITMMCSQSHHPYITQATISKFTSRSD
jgi:hypothetical protein